LEIGFGTGLNLPHYPAGVGHITAVDTNAGMQRRALRRLAQSGIAVQHQVHSAERLPFADGSFDCAVSTFTLCSVADARQVLSELFRVLKPGGRLLYLEHGLSPDPAVQRWQRRLNRLQMLLGDGCHLDRNFRELLAGQGWSELAIAEHYLKDTPQTHGYLYRGTATK
jgi:ubiquinone/menaquinone biosynthesis C-methylase UbiE